MDVLVPFLLLAGGFALLAGGGESLVRGATSIARLAGLSPAVVGLTVVAMGTSVPELVVSLVAALEGLPDDLASGPSRGSEDGELHPVQRAYIEQGATQCGFCTPGFIISTIALLEKNPNPTLQEIYDGHKWNICRCTGHNAIIRAVQQAAGQTPQPLPPVKQPLNAISRPLPRPDVFLLPPAAGGRARDSARYRPCCPRSGHAA